MEASITSRQDSANGALLHALRRKILVPQLPSGHLDRSDLLLSRLAVAGCVFVLAPAGYGKTSVLAAGAAVLAPERRLSAYQCDSLDNESSRFATGLTHILGDLCDAPVDHSGPEEQQVLACLNAIADAGQHCTLLVDDVDALTDSDSHDLLRLLIRFRPLNLQLVISGRFLPFAAGSLLLDTAIAWIRADDLAFSRDDVAQCLERQQIVMNSDQVPGLWRRTAGWPAGLALWLVAWRCAGMPDRWSGELGLAEMSDYLTGEVLNRLPLEQRELLCSGALLGTFNEALLEHVCGTADIFASFRALLQRDLYLQEVPGRPEWYAMQPLVAQCLARSFAHARRDAAHTAAYQWFRDRNEPMPALYHACQAGAGKVPLDWLEQQSDVILAGLDIRGLLDWFTQLNDDQLYGSTDLLRVACWTHLLSHRLDAAGGLIQRFGACKDVPEGELSALQGYHAGLSGHLSRAERFCRLALEQLPGERFSIRFLCASMLSAVAMAHRDPDGARIWNRFSLDIARKHRQPALEAMAHLDHGRIEFNRGHVNRCLDVLNQGLEVLDASRAHEGSMAYGRLLVLRAAVSWITGADMRMFEEQMSQALMTCEERRDPAAAYGYAIRALNLMGQGTHGLALSVLDDGERHLQAQQVDLSGYAWLHTVRANIWISQAKYRRAHDCLDALLVDADSAGVARCEYGSLLPGFAILTRARLQLMSGQVNDCLQVTDQWLRHTPNGFMSTFIRLIRAGALVMSQQHGESIRQIEMVRRTFRAEGLNQQLHNWLPDLASFLRVPEMTQAPAVVVAGTLSDREKDVLQLMAQGMSNQDIADKLFISLHTVKTHARKVNVKLGTRSRTQAIHRAKELMLI